MQSVRTFTLCQNTMWGAAQQHSAAAQSRNTTSAEFFPTTKWHCVLYYKCIKIKAWSNIKFTHAAFIFNQELKVSVLIKSRIIVTIGVDASATLLPSVVHSFIHRTATEKFHVKFRCALLGKIDK